MAVFYTADTHFGDQRTLALSRRPFTSIQAMDEAMIRRWNEIVKPNDIVHHLGDFGNYEIAKQLNGRIVLLLGNYERNDILNNRITLKQLESLFSQVIKENTIIHTLEGSSGPIGLVHEPSYRLPEMFNLFGHIHKLQMVKRNGLNVGVDCHDFTPISLSTVLFYKKAIQMHYDQEVFME